MLRVLDRANDPGKGRDSEDRVGHRAADGLAWIIDGATDVCTTRLFPEAPSDAWWFAGTAQELLERLPAGPPSTMVDGLLAELRVQVEAAIGRSVSTIPLGDRPGASLTLANFDPERQRMTFAGFPDCTTLILPSAGAGFAVPKPPPRHDEQAQARRLIAGGADIKAVLRAERASRTPSYPTLGVHPEAVASLDLRTLAAPPGTRVLLCTDGLYRLVDMYRQIDDDGLIRAALDDGLATLVGRLRGFEADAAEDGRYGRFKTSDDAAALLLEVT